MTSKERAYWRSQANGIPALFQVGKGGISDALIKQTDDALKARELIKMKVQENCMLSPAEAANELAEKTKSEVVQVIGSKFVLFKRNPQNPKIDLKTK